MDGNESSEGSFDPMEEIRKAELQDELVADAFNNSYRLLFKAVRCSISI